MPCLPAATRATSLLCVLVAPAILSCGAHEPSPRATSEETEPQDAPLDGTDPLPPLASEAADAAQCAVTVCRGISCEWARWPATEVPTLVPDGAVLKDAATGLTWERTSTPVTGLQRAADHCAHLAATDHCGWRLPSVNELLTWVNLQVPQDGSTAAPSAGLQWSSTQRVLESGTLAFGVDGASGAVKGLPADPPAPSWVRCVRGEVEATEGRFDVGSDVVLDQVTGLAWLAAPGGLRPWDEANAACESATLGGHGDWRLPTFKEAVAVMDLRHPHPAVPRAFASGMPGERAEMWTASYALGTTGHWLVDEDSGDVSVVDAGLARFRCVRAFR